MMLRFHVMQNLRSAFFLAVLFVVLAVPLAIWHANRGGLPDAWRHGIERELAGQGIHLEMEALRYLPFRGIEAKNVRVFADPERENELSRIGRVLLDFDKTRLARGDIRLNKIQLADANVLLAADAADPDPKVLELTGVNGSMAMPGGRVLEIRNATGRIGGVEVGLDARLLGYRGTTSLPAHAEEPDHRTRREFIASLTDELGRWSFPDDQRPRIAIRIDGDLADMRTFASSFEFHAPVMSLNNHPLEDVRLAGSLSGLLLHVEDISATDAGGGLVARADYDIAGRSGRFDLDCTLDLETLARAWFGLETPDEVIFGGAQSLRAEGEFALRNEGRMPEIQATGHLACGSLMVQGVVFDRVESEFSLRDNDVFLSNARVERDDGMARGRVMIRWPDVRLAMESTMPPPVYRPFFKGRPLEEVIDSFTVGDDSETRVVIEGGAEVGVHGSWHYEGYGTVGNVAFNGIPVASATTEFTVSHDDLDFRDGSVVFDTSGYGQRTAFGGPGETRVEAGRIRYSNPDRLVEIRDVTGDVWAPPVLGLFNPALAETLEAYQFHRPPGVRATGVVDLTPAGRTELDVEFSTSSPAVADVLGQPLTFRRAKGVVRLRGERVEVRDLDLIAFNGPVSASFIHDGGELSAEIAWTRVDLRGLAGAYGVTMQGGGSTTGRIEFSIADNDIATLGGKGHAAFQDAHLFAVPILGPLSPLIAAIVDDRRTGYERAKDAFLTFHIEDGVIRSYDFRTTTTSLAFTGDGEVDLNDNSLDMTMRVNARGLLGLITLPLRPFYGLFQFRGTGPVREPEWENVMFTNPPAAQKENLLNPPKARVVAEP